MSARCYPPPPTHTHTHKSSFYQAEDLVSCKPTSLTLFDGHEESMACVRKWQQTGVHQVPKKNPVWMLGSQAIKLPYRIACQIASAFADLWQPLDHIQTTAKIERPPIWSVCMSWTVTPEMSSQQESLVNTRYTRRSSAPDTLSYALQRALNPSL